MAVLDIRAPERRLDGAQLDDLLSLVRACLTDDSNVVRCAASQVMAALGNADSAELLVDLLLDEDPDVRADAMAALVRCARPQDAEAIVESLAGDPEPDVKRSAIRSLARLKHGPSLPLVASLAMDRSEDQVVWQDDTIGWDEWNDIQPEAIEALGGFGSQAMVSTLLEIHAGEWGPDLEPLLFAALAKIPGSGIQSLVDHASTTVGKTRARAITALMHADPQLLKPLIPVLRHSDDTDGRLLAAHALADDRQALADLALGDPSATVRRAALTSLCPLEPDFALSALADEDETIRATALDQLRLSETEPDNPDLVANVEAWAAAAGMKLACACADYLSEFPGPNSREVLIELSADTGRPQEVRLSALRALARFEHERSLDTLEFMAANPVRQIRLASLTALAAIAKSGEAKVAGRALNILCQAMGGEFDVIDRQEVGGEEGVDDLAAPKIEGRSAGRITITPDGDIVDAMDDVSPQDRAASTLDAIQDIPSEPPLDEQSGVPRKNGRRIAVDGPDDIGADIRILAFGVSGDCPGNEIANAIAEGTRSEHDQVRAAAFNAIARRADVLDLECPLLEIAVDATTDQAPFIRGKAAYAIAKGTSNPIPHLAPLKVDQDAIVRSIAIGETAISAPSIAISAMADSSALVRAAALNALLTLDRTDHLTQGLKKAFAVGATDTLTQAANRSSVGRSCLIGCLSDADRSTNERLAALRATVDTDPACWQLDSHLF